MTLEECSKECISTCRKNNEEHPAYECITHKWFFIVQLIIIQFYVCNSFTAKASASGFIPHSHKLTSSKRLCGSNLQFNNKEISYNTCHNKFTI